jgi:C-terminal peptidase prc
MLLKKSSVILFLAALLLSCQKKADPAKLISALEKAVIDHYYFYDGGPAFSEADYEAAARAMDPQSAWKPADDPASALVKRINDVPEAQRQDSIRRALNALLGSSKEDRHNYYIGSETARRLKDPSLNGGAGLVIFRESYGRFRIVDVLEGSAAHLAGIPQNGMLEKVDDRPVMDLELEDVVALIRGKPGTSLSLTVDGKQYTLVRGQYSIHTLRKSEWNVGGKRVLYVELRSAGKGAARELESMLMKSNNPDAIVLDLRKLNSGDFEEAFAIADLFLGSGEMGRIKRKGIAPRPMKADSNVIYSGRTYVLVSSRTSPHVKTVAMALRNSDKVKFIGPDISLTAFAGVEVPLEGDGYAMIIEAVIEPAEGRPSHLHPDTEIDDFIPVNPPSTKPDEQDPAHAELLKAL